MPKLFYLIFLSINFTSAVAYGQIVTLSFDRTTLSKNPAAAVTRKLSQISIFANQRKTQSDLTDRETEDEFEAISNNNLTNKFLNLGFSVTRNLAMGIKFHKLAIPPNNKGPHGKI